MIITSYPGSKRVNGKIICLCTRMEENLFTCKISDLVLVMLLHEDDESVKIILNGISYLVSYFHLIFCMQLPFYMFSTLMSLENESEGEN